MTDEDRCWFRADTPGRVRCHLHPGHVGDHAFIPPTDAEIVSFPDDWPEIWELIQGGEVIATGASMGEVLFSAGEGTYDEIRCRRQRPEK